jgi:hypothetical protein
VLTLAGGAGIQRGALIFSVFLAIVGSSFSRLVGDVFTI